MVPLAVGIHPEIASLPVFVRGGAILPIAPLMQNTNETPRGPLTLRVYSGDACTGHIYLDDGKTYAYKTGANLRMDFQCQVTADGMRLQLGEHKGSFPAWWQQIRIEIYGWSPRKRAVHLNGKTTEAALDVSPNRVALTIPDDGRGEVLELE
jgi:alpha-glucosidase